MTVKLEYKGMVVECRRVDGKKERQRVIKSWRLRYGPKFNDCVLIVSMGNI